MKNLYLLLIVLSCFIYSCKKDDVKPNVPKQPNAGEVENMTTLILELVNTTDVTDTVKALYRDVDGSGGLPWHLDSLLVTPNTVYNARITLLDESNSKKIIDVTDEIEKEKDFHQFFFYATAGVKITTEYMDKDNLNKPFGMVFKMTTRELSSGLFRVKLSHFTHKEDKDGVSANGGTDIYVEFPTRITLDP